MLTVNAKAKRIEKQSDMINSNEVYMGFDTKDFKQSFANTARAIHELNLQMEEENRRKAEKESKLLAGAEANIEQKTLLEEQLQIISEQNGLLCDNYNKLKELYDNQVATNQETKAELVKTRRFNTVMMIISAVAMLAAIASPIVTIFVSN